MACVTGMSPTARDSGVARLVRAFLLSVAQVVFTLGGASPDAKTDLHWSFQPVVRPPLPGRRGGSSANPIDLFLGARLAEHKLDLSPEADRRTLARRLYFDLLGLPPSPEQVAAFIADRRPGAYERLVDRLLASPHYGERWARHWLDGVRFAETHGFEMNNPRPNAWPYRDYVIASLNLDLPYDRFVLEQLAGDAFGVDDATGFLVAGPWDQVKSPDETLTRNQRADELHDIINATGATFLGLTLGCARCHDHKFDPVSQADYYAIKAVFEGVQHGERDRRGADEARRAVEAGAARTRIAELEAQLAKFEPLAQAAAPADTSRLRAPVNARRNVDRFSPVPARRLRFVIEATSDGSEPCLDELEVFGPARADNLALASNGVVAHASGVYPNSDLHKLDHLNDGRYGNSRSWISDTRGAGWVELEFPAETTVSRVVWGRDRDEKYQDRVAVRYRIETFGDDGVGRVAASSGDRQPFQPGGNEVAPLAIGQPGESAATQAAALSAALKEEQTRLRQALERRRVYSGEFREPEPTRRFYRGDPMQPRDEVAPGGLSFAAFHAEGVSQPAATPERKRRLALARWIASQQNPLTARVIVNRLWQGHFGEGIVSTPSDFGRNGAQPTHPQLLDWLAAELMRPAPAAAGAPGATPWSLKHLHRLILTSAAYRQSSAARPEGLAADAGDRLLWRYPPRRLEAEPLRDAILAVASKLDLRMGGPGWSPFEPNENYVRVYTPKDHFGPDDFRRMVYATVVRQRPDGVFGVFDCPDGGQIAPKRTRSTTPLQALNLLNSGFISQTSGFLAARLEREVGGSPEAQAARAFELAFQRSASPEEAQSSAAFIRREGLRNFCRAIFNANEFAYVF